MVPTPTKERFMHEEKEEQLDFREESRVLIISYLFSTFLHYFSHFLKKCEPVRTDGIEDTETMFVTKKIKSAQAQDRINFRILMLPYV